MSTSLIRRISIVNKNGISIAEYPQRAKEEIASQQLESGFLSAILSFSKEVHKTELESLSFHDRTVTFIPYSNYYFVPEYSSTVSSNLIEHINEEMRDRIENLVDTEVNLQYAAAKQVLERLIQREWIEETLDQFGLTKPLQGAEIITDSDKTSNRYHEMISRIISSNEAVDIQSFLLPLPDTLQCLFVVYNGVIDNYAFLQFPYDKVNSLFKIVPTLNTEIKYLRNTDVDEPVDLLKQIRNTHDTGFTLNEEDLELVSLDFLKKNIGKHIDQALSGVVTGKQLVIVGDKLSVKIVIYSLQLFVQHLNTDVVVWLEMNEDKIGSDITGLDIEKFKELNQSNGIPENAIILNIDNGRVRNGTKNSYLKDMFNKSLKMNKLEAKEWIRKALEKLVNHSLEVTSLVALEEEQAKMRIKLIQEKVDNKDKFDLIKELATQRNPLLNDLVSQISATLKSAEDYLSYF